MQVTILSVNIETKPTKTGKTYQLADVAFKGDDGKVSGKKVMSFGATEKAFKVLADNSVGKTFDVESVKNGAGYWDWTNLSVASAPAAGATSSNAPSVGRSTSNSTYATAEERAKTQVYIVKQSCLAQAVALLSVGAKTPPSTNLVLKQAQEFVDFVFSEKAASINDLTDLPNDLPFDAEVS